MWRKWPWSWMTYLRGTTMAWSTLRSIRSPWMLTWPSTWSTSSWKNERRLGTINILFGSCFASLCNCTTSILGRSKHKEKATVMETPKEIVRVVEQKERNSIYSRPSEYNLVMVQKHWKSFLQPLLVTWRARYLWGKLTTFWQILFLLKLEKSIGVPVATQTFFADQGMTRPLTAGDRQSLSSLGIG